MSECAACTSLTPPPGASNEELPFQLVERLCSESHEGAHLTSCRHCGRLFLHLWAEVGGWEVEDLWRYWVPVSAAEADRFRALFSLDEDEAFREIRRFIDTRRRLVRDPDRYFSWRDLHGEPGLYMPT
jgi:hypothetical protein